MIYVLTTAWAINLLPYEEKDEDINDVDDIKDIDYSESNFSYYNKFSRCGKKNKKDTKRREDELSDDDESSSSSDDCENINFNTVQEQRNLLCAKDNCENNNSFLGIISNVLNTPGTFWISFYIFIYKMGERGAINNFPLFLLDKGMAKDKINFWNGTVCQFLSIIGSFYGGFIITKEKSKNNLKSILIQNTIQRMMSICLQYIIVVYWDSYAYLHENCEYHLHATSLLSLCYLSYTSGIISTATFTLMMTASRFSPMKSQGSHYSLLASVEVAGKLLFAISAGFLIDHMGFNFAFATFMILSVSPLYVLMKIHWKMYYGKES